MKKPIVFMFSGQGSQYFNMGMDFYTSDSVFRNTMEKLDSIFINITGKSVLRVLYDSGKKIIETFNNLFYTHPAIFMVEYSIAQVLLEMGIYPDFVLGASLGEFAAAAVSGVVSCEDILQCLVKQVQLLESCCEKGGMLAVVCDYKLFNQEPVIYKNSELAGVNYDSHFIVSGSIEGLSRVENFLKSKEILFFRLPVLYAFHSSLIDPINMVYNEFLNTISYKSSKYGFISCMAGGKATNFGSSFFWSVVREPIDFKGALGSLNSQNEYIYVDLGPSGTLANFARQNLGNGKASSVFSTITQFNNGMNNLAQLRERINRI